MNILLIISFYLINLSNSFYVGENMKFNNEYENYNNNNNIEYIDGEQDNDAENMIEKPQIENSKQYKQKPLNNAYIFNIMNQTFSSMSNNSVAFIETLTTSESSDKRSNQNNNNNNKNSTTLAWSDSIEESSSGLTNNTFYIIIVLMAVLTVLFVSLFVYILVK
jgi:hypothetical protein